MKKPFLLATLAVFAAAAVFFLTPLGVHASNPPKSNTVKTDTYMVVKILDKYKVIGTSRLKDEQKRVKDDYDEKVKEWKDARKSDPNAAKPPQPIIKKIKTGFITQKGAQDYLDKLMEEEDKDSDKPK